MQKRILSLLLTLVLLVSILPMTAHAEELDNGLVYKIHEDHKYYGDHAEITGYVGNATEVVIPAQIDGYPVTIIGYDAFLDCSSLTNIVIPDSVTHIFENAFAGCSSLTSIDLPDSLTYIDDTTFKTCTSLTSIDIPDSVTSISVGVFTNCTSLTSIDIPDRVTSIGDNAFWNCTSLTVLNYWTKA